jgi:TonB family protein
MKLILALVLAVFSSVGFAQGLPSESTVKVSKLAETTSYPDMARRARISGSVELSVIVRPDGSVESVSVVSGHPMLNPAAVESAQRTEYECKDCNQLTPHRMTYRFELGEAVFCDGIDATGHGIYDQKSYQRVSQSGNTITVFDRPFGTCDPTVKTSFERIRSAKCLYLWRCGKRPL